MRATHRALFVVLVVGAALGCVLVDLKMVVPGRPATFPHQLHGEDNALDCGDCHRKYEDSDEAGMPSVGQCLLCHDEDEQEERPPARRVSAFLVEGEVLWSSVTSLSEEVLFSHRVHYEQDVECESCHRGVTGSDAVSRSFGVTMDDCTDCHAERQVSVECSTCHQVIDRGWLPPNHARNWTEFHGQIARSGVAAGQVERCALCHEETTCIRCHLDEPPRDHGNFWRHRGHGIGARVDRDRCATCHRTDFCDRCHSETAPRNHTARWGGSRSFHCTGCHTPLAAQSCAVCHRGTPSHLMATPIPANHLANPPAFMDCRLCHNSGATLPHVDNGDACTDCHN